MNDLKCCNTILIQHNDACYAFDYINYEIMKLNNEQKMIFKLLISDKKIPALPTIRRDLLPIILKIKDGLFFTQTPIKLHTGTYNKNACIISFPIVHSCNLNCKYCFAKSGNNYKGVNKKFNISIINKIFEYLPIVFEDSISDVRVEFVSGGETLLNKELYKNIITHMKTIAEANNFNLQIFTLTNGTTLDENIISFINTTNGMLGISLDGTPEIHNYHRPFSNGSGTYELIISNLKKLRKTDRSYNLWAVTVITSHTNSLIDILRHNKQIGIKSMEMRIVRGRNKYNISITENNIDHFKSLYCQFSEYLKNNIADLYLIINDYDTFGKIIKRLLLKEKVIYRCHAGKSKFSFTADGDVFPCDSFVGYDEFKIGNIFTKEKNKEVQTCFFDMSIEKLQNCAECQFRYLCGGDCYYNRIYNDGHYLFCELQKYLCILAIDLIFHISNSNINEFNKLVSFAKLRNKAIII